MALPNNPTQAQVVKAVKDLENAPAQATDVQVNGTSITSGGVANIVTESAYNASTNKIATKNDITKANIGLSNVANERQYSANNPPPYPVTSVNGKTGAVTGLATSNPNLLINSNFAINQRNGYIFRGTYPFYSDAGLTNQIGTTDARVGYVPVQSISGNAANITISYTPDNGSTWTTANGYVALSACTSGYVATGYTVDRWTLDNGGTLTPTSDGITLTGGCRQFIENKEQLWGKTLTLSFKTASGITSKSGTLPSTAPSSNTTFISAPTDSSGVNAIVRYVNGLLAVVINSNLGATINWVKLEMGDVATEYTPPLIAEELLKCYRYYRKYVASNNYSNYFGIGIFYWSTTRAFIPFKFTTPMRRTPTFSYAGAWRMTNTNISATDITLSIDQASKEGCSIAATSASGGITSGTSALLSANNDATAYIAFDAEL